MTIKEIVTLKGLARFSHAIAGTLYYKIETDDVTVEFPITLMRYIRKAIENETLVITKTNKSQWHVLGEK